MSKPLVIDYYTDILCIWAWIAQRRIDELDQQWGTQIELNHHCVNVFGDTAAKMDSQWADRGGYDGFAEHVAAAAASYEDAPVTAALWKTVRPTTSANAHLMLKAAQLTGSTEHMVQLAGHLRQAFFVDGVDIGKLENLRRLAVETELSVPALSGPALSGQAIDDALASGQAMAALMSDYARAEQHGIHGSPSWVMNQGRQILYGNVGYRILNANVEELLRHPEQEASWC
jgi:predicted DsbA family dithiol-disulfide isomerase